MATRRFSYVCYDLKGIQSFIFAVPRLRYICGGSAIVDRFDRHVVRGIKLENATLLFSGGGRGAFRCADDAAAGDLERQLVRCAHDEGLGICLGRDEDYGEAARRADRSYPYLPGPGQLDGHPCDESGLYPTMSGTHPMIARRVWQRGDRMDRYFESEILAGCQLPDRLDAGACEFFHDVDPATDEGYRACRALGGRNRWAVVAMDGNDIGAQHRVAAGKWASDPALYGRWLGAMSTALDVCSRSACSQALAGVLSRWDSGEQAAATSGNSTILPFRPLVVGGDDVIVLVHVRHAVDFVFEMCRAFEACSRKESEKARRDGIELWPATGGALSISAGILFAPVTLPLAAALPYAESLLASAKNRGRHSGGGPAPACMDWESVTEGLLDSPHARRQRELRFHDKDLSETVELTRRPYSLEEMGQVLALVKGYQEMGLPGSIRHQAIEGLRCGYWDRQVFAARLGKHQQRLFDQINEGGDVRNPGGRWVREERPGEAVRHTDVVDALLLMEEDARMAWQIS